MVAVSTDDSSFVELIIYFFIGLFASFYGSITGGAGMLSIPALVLGGVPVEIAVASNKLGDLGRFLLSSYRFAKSGQVQWRYAYVFIPIAVIGSIIGAQLLTYIDTDGLTITIGVAIFCMIPLLLFNRNLGLQQSFPGKRRQWMGYFLYFLASIYGASVQLGSGPIMLYLIMGFFGLTMIQSNATSSIAWIFITICSIVVLLVHGWIDLNVGIPLFIGSAVGGYLGANLAVKKGNKWARNLLAVVIFVMALKIIYDGISQ